MDIVHYEGVRIIHYLQSQWNHAPSVNLFTTLPQYIADPDTLCKTVLPFLFALDKYLALRFLLTVGIVDTANNIVKWVLQGERPYWWVREATHVDNLPDLTHYPLTCETGPGSPSGHAMLSGAIGFVLISYLCSLVKHYGARHHMKRFWVNFMWSIYVTTLVLVSTARLMLATHFPHQVLCGSIVGLLCGWLVCRMPLKKLTTNHCIGAALFLFAWATATYFGLNLLGIDPSRTLKLALKHCSDVTFVHLTTTPWHAVYRNLALLTGTGLAIQTSQWTTASNRAYTLSQKILIACVSLIVVRTIGSVPYPVDPHYVFYVCAFLKNVCYVHCCLVVVPFIVDRLPEMVATPPSSPVDIKEQFVFRNNAVRKSSVSTAQRKMSKG